MSTSSRTNRSAAGEGRPCAGRPDSTRDLVVGTIAVACGLAVAVVITLLASLSAALLHADPVWIFTVAGGTFVGCLTLEIGLAGVFAAFRRRVP